MASTKTDGELGLDLVHEPWFADPWIKGLEKHACSPAGQWCGFPDCLEFFLIMEGSHFAEMKGIVLFCSIHGKHFEQWFKLASESPGEFVLNADYRASSPGCWFNEYIQVPWTCLLNRGGWTVRTALVRSPDFSVRVSVTMAIMWMLLFTVLRVTIDFSP